MSVCERGGRVKEKGEREKERAGERAGKRERDVYEPHAFRISYSIGLVSTALWSKELIQVLGVSGVFFLNQFSGNALWLSLMSQFLIIDESLRSHSRVNLQSSHAAITNGTVIEALLPYFQISIL